MAKKDYNKILLIDDEEDILRVLSLSLKSDGYSVITALSGRQGIVEFEKYAPDIILTDLKMPDIDGIGVLKKVKAINPDTEVIVVTGHGDMDSAIDSLRYGASDFINKPIRDEVLRIALERAKEKISVREQLKSYMNNLEAMLQNAVGEVRRMSEFQDNLIRSSNDGIVATDERGTIIIYNPGAEMIFGHHHDDVLRKMNFRELYPPEIADELFQAFEQRRISGGTEWKECTISGKDGNNVPARFFGTLLHEGTSLIGSVGFFQDLRELKRLEQELVQSERLAAIGQTIARLAHYIKNILAGLKGGTYIVNIGLDKQDTVKLKAGWVVVQRNISRVSSLVADLLSYSKEREPDYRLCFPNDIVNDICELMEMEAARNKVRLVRDLSAQIGQVYVDADMLYRALLNLVTNAIDACIYDLDMSKEHAVTVKTEMDESTQTLYFRVIDNGTGMSDEVRDKLFTAFFSTKGGKGTGLGLLVTKKLVQEHGGDIGVTTKKDKGTQFTISIPLREKPGAGVLQQEHEEDA